MPSVNVSNAGKFGLVTDIDKQELPPEAWTALKNVRCQRNYIESFAGHSDMTTTTGTPHFVLPLPAGSSYYWVYATDTTANGTPEKLYSFDGSMHSNITHAAGDYTGAAWNGCVIGGIAVLNNGTDNPQYWAGTGVAQDMIYDGATTWAVQNYKAAVIRSFKGFLFALNITDAGTNYPHMLHWSDPAEPGTMPSTWDYSATTNQSGRTELSETGGFLVDGLPLRDVFVLYKEDAVYICQYIGGEFVFQFQRLAGVGGALAQGCVADLGTQHFVVSDGDVYLHDGNSAQSIIEGANRDLLFDDMDGTNYALTHVVHHRDKNEVWICYPTTGNSTCNAALVWNTKTQAWSKRSLPSVRHMTTGVLTATGGAWDSDVATWDSDSETWGERTYSPTSDALVGAGDTLIQFDDGNQFDGVNPICRAERVSIPIGGTREVNTITRIYPRMSGTGAVNIYVGSQMTIDTAPTWQGPYAFEPGVDQKVDCLVTGAYHAIAVESNDNISWRLAGYEFDYEPAGRL